MKILELRMKSTLRVQIWESLRLVQLILASVILYIHELYNISEAPCAVRSELGMILPLNTNKKCPIACKTGLAKSEKPI